MVLFHFWPRRYVNNWKANKQKKKLNCITKHVTFCTSGVPLFPHSHQTDVFLSGTISPLSKLTAGAFFVLFCFCFRFWVLPNDKTWPNVSRTSNIDLHGLCFRCSPSTSFLLSLDVSSPTHSVWKLPKTNN